MVYQRADGAGILCAQSMDLERSSLVAMQASTSGSDAWIFKG